MHYNSDKALVTKRNEEGCFSIETDSYSTMKAVTPKSKQLTYKYSTVTTDFIIFPYYVSKLNDQTALIDEKGNEIWNFKKQRLEVTHHNNQFYILKEVKKGEWAIYNKELKLLGNTNFHNVIGSNGRLTVVEYNGMLQSLNYKT